MTSIKSLSQPALESTACLSDEQMREYLSGWSDEGELQRIEAHLSQCEECEQTLQHLDVGPDTLMQSLQGTAKDNPLPVNDDSAAATALERVRRLMDVPQQTAADRIRAGWQPAERTFGGYELLKPLGRGGMGAVYLASHRQLNKQVAIKLLPLMSAEDAAGRARFEREIRVVGRLNHPAIVAATDAGEIDGTQYLVMEYVPGLDLSRLARVFGPLSIADACELMRQTALGLSVAHAEGVVHRDVKPSNLMLDGTGKIRILDFGLAQLTFRDEASADLTTVGQLLGTLDYMAPEQAEHCGAVDYRADLYALGATLFRLLCNRPPLAAAPNQSPLEKLRLLANHQPPKLNTLCPEAPVELVAVVSSLLARDPCDRPPSAAHMAEQLAPFAADSHLTRLLNEAQQKAAQLPELLVQPSHGVAGLPGLRQNHSVNAGNAGGRTNWRRWMMAAALPLLALAGILIKLETDKGQLVIESEVDNVMVRIVGDGGERVSGLSINHGTTATKLRADKYEVTIEGSMDGLTIDNDQFVLLKGETVVARIRQQPVEPETISQQMNPAVVPPAATATKPEPLYEGKTLSNWLDMLTRERSAAGLRSAFDACKALATPETSHRITRTILNVVPGLDGETLLFSGDGSNTMLDLAAAEVLRKANPGAAFYRLWVREFEAADESWRNRLWSQVRWYGMPAEGIEPIVAWAESRLKTAPSGNPADDAHTITAADFLRGLSNRRQSEHLQTIAARVVPALKASPHLGPEWWLKLPLVFRSERSGNRGSQFGEEIDLWPAVIESEVIRVAVDVIDDSKSKKSLVAQACLILAHGAELDVDQKAKVLAAMDRRLIELCADPAALNEVIKVEFAFRDFATPLLSIPRFYIQSENEAGTYLVLAALDVVKNLAGFKSVQTGCQALSAAVQPVRQITTEQAAAVKSSRPANRGRSPREFITLNWPELTLVEDRGGALGGGGSPRDLATLGVREIWGDHEPTPQDWLMYCILQHPVMQQALAGAAAPANAAASEELQTPQSTPQP